jgi:hypothetical protein
MDFGTAEEIPVECEYPVLTIKHNDGKSWQADISNRITQFHKLPCFFVVSELGGGDKHRTLELLASIRNYYKRFAYSSPEDHRCSL